MVVVQSARIKLDVVPKFIRLTSAFKHPSSCSGTAPCACEFVTDSPRLFNRETVESQHLPQCILGTVDDVLLLLVVQLLLHDVLTEVEHHLKEDGQMHHGREPTVMTLADILTPLCVMASVDKYSKRHTLSFCALLSTQLHLSTNHTAGFLP